tara:strand:- start:2941 stop:3300 length:360 start_codon:yes stop_codon:yes gene_type:complete
MKTIILDTNFIIHSIEFKIDFLREIDRICHFQYQLAIIDKTIEEINKLKNPLALKLVKSLKSLKSTESTVDLEILKRANKELIVATQDKELRKALKEKNAQLITIRQKSHLTLENQNIY